MGAALLALLLAGGCDWMWPLDSANDPCRCDPPCAKDQVCHEGRCVASDAGTDGPPKDAPRPDLPRADLNDARVDTVAPDSWSVVQPAFKTVQPGKFTMGSPGAGQAGQDAGSTAPEAGPDMGAADGGLEAGAVPGELCRGKNETQHQVTLSGAYEIAGTETTQGHFLSLMGYNPSKFSTCGSTCPVENVSWHEAAAYCNALSTQKGHAACYSCSGAGKPTVICSVASSYSGAKIYACPGYRLPTEAEWERAYRAGSTTAFYAGGVTSCQGSDPTAGLMGWYSKNASNRPHPAGTRQANAWGLSDMAGNVWEWCHDWSAEDLGSAPATDPWGAPSGTGRVVRGGSWFSDARALRAAHRSLNPPTDRGHVIGLRCVRSVK